MSNKKSIPIIAYMAVHNGAEFIRQSIESVIGAVDKLVILEGAWGENVAVNGQPRSTDGTLEIIDDLQNKYDNIEAHQYNDRSQLEQRNRVFNHIPDDCWLFILDHDEVWDTENLAKLWMLLQRTDDSGIKVKSLTFVNDRYTYSPISFPRCFRIKPNRQYVFCAPNDLFCDGKQVNVKPHEDIEFYHYSYCHTPERFMEKKRERTKINGHFPWELDNNKVVRPDANIMYFDGNHPDAMRKHSLMSKRPQRTGDHYVIVQHSGIGNAISLTQLAKSIRIMFPLAKITILTWFRSSRILENWPVVDEVSCVDPNAYFSSLKSPVKEIMISPIGSLSINQSIRDRMPIMEIEMSAPWTMHESEYNMLFARELGWEGDSPKPEIFIEENNRRRAQKILCDHQCDGKFLAVNASYLHKEQWPKKHFGNKKYIDFLTWFAQKHEWPIVFVGAKEDFDNADYISSMINDRKILNLCGYSEDIKDTAAILEFATVTVGNDGSLNHISATVGTPTVTIFTFTNTKKNKPIGDNAIVAAIECNNRLMCQHGGYNQCKCLDVPLELVISKFEKVCNERG